MTDMVPEFATPQEALAHYGVKGMKWGVTKTKPTADEIHDARARLTPKNRQYQKDRKAIKKDKTISRSERKEAIGDLKIATLSDPDRQTAFRMTNGEKAIMALLTVAAPPTAVAVAVSRSSINRQLKDAAAQQRYKESQSKAS